MKTNESTIGIVGAGIGGLAAAIALARVYGYDAWTVPLADAAPIAATA